MNTTTSFTIGLGLMFYAKQIVREGGTNMAERTKALLGAMQPHNEPHAIEAEAQRIDLAAFIACRVHAQATDIIVVMRWTGSDLVTEGFSRNVIERMQSGAEYIWAPFLEVPADTKHGARVTIARVGGVTRIVNIE